MDTRAPRRAKGSALGVGICLLALALGCAAALPEPTAAHLARARESEPQLTLDDLTRGRSVYAGKCSGCHALIQPDAVTASSWPSQVDEMQAKQGVKLTPGEERDLVRYLVVSSEVPRR